MRFSASKPRNQGQVMCSCWCGGRVPSVTMMSSMTAPMEGDMTPERPLWQAEEVRPKRFVLAHNHLKGRVGLPRIELFWLDLEKWHPSPSLCGTV